MSPGDERLQGYMEKLKTRDEEGDRLLLRAYALTLQDLLSALIGKNAMILSAGVAGREEG